MDPQVTLLEKFTRRMPIGLGRTLVVGSKLYDEKEDRRNLYENAFGVDLLAGDGVDLVHDLEHPLPESVGQFDHIDCVSVLEHVQRPWKMAESLEQCLKENGSILVCVPFVWRVHAYPSDYWRMTPEALSILFPNIEWLRRKYIADGKFRKLVPRVEHNGTPYLARAEVVGFGVKRLTSYAMP